MTNLHLFYVITYLFRLDMDKQFASVKKTFRGLRNLHILLFYLVFNLGSSCLLLIGWLFFHDKWDIPYLLTPLSVLFLLYHFIQGVSSGRKTHFPIYKLVLFSQFINPYYIFVLKEISWLFIFNLWVYITFGAIFCTGHTTSSTTLLGLFTLYLLAICLWVIGNRLRGIYLEHIISHKIGIVRFLFFLLKHTLVFAVGYITTSIMIPIIYMTRKCLPPIHAFLDKGSWMQVESILDKEMSGTIQDILTTLQLYIKHLPLLEFGYTTVTAILILVTLTFYILLKGVDYRIDASKKIQRDALSFYSRWLSFLNRFILNKDFIIHKSIQELKNSRFLVSDRFYSLSLISSEISFYFAVVVALFPHVNSYYKVALLFIFFVLSLTNKCYELRSEFPYLFLINSERQNIRLFLLQGESIVTLYKSRLYFMYLVLIIPLILCCAGCLILIFLSKKLYNPYWLLLFPSLITCYIVAPIIQLYGTPLLGKFKYDHIQEVGTTEEEQLFYSKLQAIPRNITIVPILYIYYVLMLFIQLPLIIKKNMVIGIILYYLLSSILFITFSKKVTSKGLRDIDCNVHKYL